MSEIWDELGIAPCDDPKVIRRAYAARLRQLDPDREPDAFARLREAYERALDLSRRKGPARPSAEPHHASTTNDGSVSRPRSCSLIFWWCHTRWARMRARTAPRLRRR
ncbi:MAG TPA: J domain-containing protein [Burkholderiaceae bacterium]